jgi:hypothetical protein
MNKSQETSVTRARQITDKEKNLLVSEVRDYVDGAMKIQEQLASSVKKLNGYDLDKTKYSSFAAMCTNKCIGVPFKARGYICTLNDVVPLYFGLGETDTFSTDTFSIVLEDTDGNLIHSATIYDDQLIERVKDLFLQHQTFDFFGCIVPKVKYTSTDKFRGMTYVFLLRDLSASDEPLQMIQSERSEIVKAEKLVKTLGKQNGKLIEYIRERLIETIGIKGLEDSPLLDRSLTAVILAALSDGYDSKRSLSHKLHTLFIGSPAVGKKLLTEAARILNPAFTEGHPGKITIPGIAGRAMYKDGAWQSEPGLIPLAHRGVFVIQDFHHVEKKKEIMGIFSMVMEDGKVIDSTAANKTHHALTAIHIDMNKHSDVYLDDKEGGAGAGCARLDDLGLSMNVLTRFDYIVDIPRDTERQMEIALMMHTGSQQTSQYPTARKVTDAERELKVLVAYLRTHFANVVIPEDLIEQYVRVKQKELVDCNRDELQRRQLLGDYQTRLSNSVHKYVFALARGNARSTATKDDVDEAFRLIRTKLEFLATIEHFEVPADWNHEPEQKKVLERRQFILSTFAGADVTVEEVHARVLKDFGKDVSPTTIRRDLKEIADKPKHGIFSLPKWQNGKLKKTVFK